MAEILVSPGERLGRYELTGPKAQNLDAIAEEYAQGLGRAVKYRAMHWEERADRYFERQWLAGAYCKSP